MAVVMKQLDKTEEAIEAIKSFRSLCSKNAQDSLDNVLIDLYKGNLGWAYMQKSNYLAAEAVYKKAQMIDPDANKACNLGQCLMKQARYDEARLVLEEVVMDQVPGSDNLRWRSRAEELLYLNAIHIHVSTNKAQRFHELVEKDLEAAIVWFWKAINAGDRVDSALKDMAVVMKQLDRTEEAIEAIKSFRSLCSKNAQDSLDNVLIDLYKTCGRVDEQIELLRQKLRKIYVGEAFNGKPAETARSNGKKFQVSVKQESSRILGNLGWAYIQQSNYLAAEAVNEKAQMIDPDANKACNLGQCLMKLAQYDEARLVLEEVVMDQVPGSDNLRWRSRAEELLLDLESR
ncbi:hypothetical protein Cgig2_009080 [Carnegiea gigantea]|uniref:Tetratricopeptide repeat protein n=1 Tax=Carnegiea gigantea TaxID=171969 RepID=A0A9Q1QGJ7_9CARY|nr:hypothetical protein Cgig2_009080 [Carnegiea gigantea]